MYREAKMEGDEEHGKLEVEGVVQIVVVDNDGRGEHYPDGNDERGGQFRFRFGCRAGGRGGQLRSRQFGLLFGAVVEEIIVFDIDGRAPFSKNFSADIVEVKERRRVISWRAWTGLSWLGQVMLWSILPAVRSSATRAGPPTPPLPPFLSGLALRRCGLSMSSLQGYVDP
jgi:hypothetical protein